MEFSIRLSLRRLVVVAVTCLAWSIALPTSSVDAKPQFSGTTATTTPATQHIYDPDIQSQVDFGRFIFDNDDHQPEESAGVGLNPIVPGIGIVQTETTSVVGRPETGISNPAPCAHCSKEIRKMAVNRMISNMDFVIGARVIGEQSTHYDLEVFAVYVTRYIPIYGLAAFRPVQKEKTPVDQENYSMNRRQKRHPSLSSASSSSSTSSSSGSIGSNEAVRASKEVPPSLLTVRKDPNFHTTSSSSSSSSGVVIDNAARCRPCHVKVKVGQNYLFGGHVNRTSQYFYLDAESTVLRWTRKIRHFAEVALLNAPVS